MTNKVRNEFWVRCGPGKEVGLALSTIAGVVRSESPVEDVRVLVICADDTDRKAAYQAWDGDNFPGNINLSFFSIDHPEDQTVILNSEYTFAVVTPKAAAAGGADIARHRVGRYPPKKDGGCASYGLWVCEPSGAV